MYALQHKQTSVQFIVVHKHKSFFITSAKDVMCLLSGLLNMNGTIHLIAHISRTSDR